MLWTKKDLMTATNALDPSHNFLNHVKGISGISIDDRSLKKGDLFIALKGDRFNGQDFIKSALFKGAGGIIVSDKKLAEKYEGLLVEDTKEALKNIAKFSRNRFQGTTIALTGSSGKTSTNHLLSSSLKQYGTTHHTHGNNNNIIGLSLTLSRLPADYKYCVLELGMNNAGEIKELSNLAQPDIALITNVSNSHIQNFKNEEEIAKAKSEIFFGLKHNGIAILNSDNIWSDLLITNAQKVNAKIHLYGFSKRSDSKKIKIIDDKKGTTIFFDNIKNWRLNHLNTTQALNAIAAISIIKELKLDLKNTLNAISNIKPLPGRGEKITINFKGGKRTFVIDDSYNANPDSMRASLSNFYNIKNKLNSYQSVLIIGDMLELGKKSNESHQKIIPLIKKIDPSLLITLGFYTKNICEELSPSINCDSYASIETLFQNIKNILKPRQLILIKGSNGTGLWKLVPFFKNYNQEEDNAA